MQGYQRRDRNETVFAKTLKVRFVQGTWTCQKEERGTSVVGRGRKKAHSWPRGCVEESRINMVGERELYKEERNVLKEDMKKIGECGLERWGTLNTSEKTIAIPGDGWWPQTAKQEGGKISGWCTRCLLGR